MYKIAQKISNFINTIILVIVLSILAALLLPRLVGYEIYAVLSGSMEPTYHVGSIIYVKKMPAEEIEIGDPIAFQKDASTIATHRAIDVDPANRQFRTKGDANEVEDVNPVSFEKVIGKGTISIPFLGFITVGIQTKKGIIIACGVLVFMIITNIIPEIVKPEKPKEGESREEG